MIEKKIKSVRLEGKENKKISSIHKNIEHYPGNPSKK